MPMCSSTAAKAASRLAASTVGSSGSGIDVGSWFPGPTGCVGGTNCVEESGQTSFIYDSKGTTIMVVEGVGVCSESD